jgi:hypothetical protein
MLLLATALTYRMATFGPRRGSANSFWPAVIAGVMRGPLLISVLLAFLTVAGIFLWPGIVQFSTEGAVTLHWSRLLAGAFSLFCAFQTVLFALLLKVVSVWQRQHTTVRAAPAAMQPAVDYSDPVLTSNSR